MPGKRRPNHRLVKIRRSYTVEEVTRTLGVHKNTVRDWIKRGLPVIDNQRPTMIHGAALIDFLQARRKNAKRPCAIDQLYCMRCRTPRVPAGRMVDFVPKTEIVGDLRGICPSCETFMHKRVSRARLDAVDAELEIAYPLADPSLTERNFPSLNSDSSGAAQTHEKT